MIPLLLACLGPAAEPAPERAADPVAALQNKPLELTRHARCRMECRHIDRDELEAVLATGRLDPSRTRTDGRCPSYLEMPS